MRRVTLNRFHLGWGGPGRCVRTNTDSPRGPAGCWREEHRAHNNRKPGQQKCQCKTSIHVGARLVMEQGRNRLDGTDDSGQCA